MAFLPMAPLIAYVEARGGIVNFVPSKHPAISQYCDFRRRKYMQHATADTFCCEILKEHPALIWGDDWWQEERPHKRKLRPACKRGHEYTPDNTGISKKDGSRRCRQCARDYANAKRRLAKVVEELAA